MCAQRRTIQRHSKNMPAYKLGRKKPTLIAPSSCTSCLRKCEKVFLLFKPPRLRHLAKAAQANQCLSGSALPRGFERSLCNSLLTSPFSFSSVLCQSVWALTHFFLTAVSVFLFGTCYYPLPEVVRLYFPAFDPHSTQATLPHIPQIFLTQIDALWVLRILY